MPDQTVVHIGENSVEQIAYKLMLDVAAAEQKTIHGNMAAEPNVDRKWILDTYLECLLTARGVRRRE